MAAIAAVVEGFESGSSPTQSQQRQLQVRDLWGKSQEDQLTIGRLLYEERKERLSVGGRGVEGGFIAWCQEAGIPRASAYRRITEYEISIGEREEKPEKPVSDETPFVREQVAQTIAAMFAANPSGLSEQQLACRQSGRASKFIADAKVVIAAYVRKHPDVYDRNLPNMEVLDLALKAAPEGVTEEAWQQMGHHERVAAMAAIEPETSAPAVEKDSESDVITDGVNFPAAKPKIQDDPEFVRLRLLAKNAGYHLALSARAGKYDLLFLTVEQVEKMVR